MVKHALAYGVRSTASVFSTTPKTVRKWLGRYHQERLAGLNELPKTPLTCPHKTSPITERKVVQLRKRYPFMGARRLKREHKLACSHEAIRRILNDNGLIRKRRKKHKRKRDLADNQATETQDRPRTCQVAPLDVRLARPRLCNQRRTAHKGV